MLGFSSKADITKPSIVATHSIATAVNVAGTFDLDANANIENATTVPHTTINAVSAAGLEYYRIDVSAGDRAIFDIDTGAGQLSDSFIELVDATGRQIASNDFDFYDAGSATNDDSRITFTFDTGGTYYIRVGRLATVAGIVVGIGTAFIAAGFNNIMNYIQALFSVFNAPLFATFIVGMF